MASVLTVQSYSPPDVFLWIKGVTCLHGIWKITLRWISKQTGCRSAFYSGLPRREISLNINVVFKAGDFRKNGFTQSALSQRRTSTEFILMKSCIFTTRDRKMLFCHKSYMFIFYYCVWENTWNLCRTLDKEPRSCFWRKSLTKRVQCVSSEELILTLTVTAHPLMLTALSDKPCRLYLDSSCQKPQRIQDKTLNTAYFYDSPFTAVYFGWLLIQPQGCAKYELRHSTELERRSVILV